MLIAKDGTPMTDNSECSRCGDTVYFGSLLCGSCSMKIKGKIEILEQRVIELEEALEMYAPNHPILERDVWNEVKDM